MNLSLEKCDNTDNIEKCEHMPGNSGCSIIFSSHFWVSIQLLWLPAKESDPSRIELWPTLASFSLLPNKASFIRVRKRMSFFVLRVYYTPFMRKFRFETVIICRKLRRLKKSRFVMKQNGIFTCNCFSVIWSFRWTPTPFRLRYQR